MILCIYLTNRVSNERGKVGRYFFNEIYVILIFKSHFYIPSKKWSMSSSFPTYRATHPLSIPPLTLTVSLSQFGGASVESGSISGGWGQGWGGKWAGWEQSKSVVEKCALRGGGWSGWEGTLHSMLLTLLLAEEKRGQRIHPIFFFNSRSRDRWRLNSKF